MALYKGRTVTVMICMKGPAAMTATAPPYVYPHLEGGPLPIWKGGPQLVVISDNVNPNVEKRNDILIEVWYGFCSNL